MHVVDEHSEYARDYKHNRENMDRNGTVKDTVRTTAVCEKVHCIPEPDPLLNFRNFGKEGVSCRILDEIVGSRRKSQERALQRIRPHYTSQSMKHLRSRRS